MHSNPELFRALNARDGRHTPTGVGVAAGGARGAADRRSAGPARFFSGWSRRRRAAGQAVAVSPAGGQALTVSPRPARRRRSPTPLPANAASSSRAPCVKWVQPSKWTGIATRAPSSLVASAARSLDRVR